MSRSNEVTAIILTLTAFGCTPSTLGDPGSQVVIPGGAVGPSGRPTLNSPSLSGSLIGQGSIAASLDPSNTFEHPDLQPNPLDVLNRIQQEGPPEITSRLHSCQKMRYATLGKVLGSLGVNLGNNQGNSAGGLYSNAGQAFGAPNYGARIREALAITTAGTTKLFDIFVAAAPEIITAMPNVGRCKVAGQSTSMFDGQGNCTLAGISCLQGYPATTTEQTLCNSVIGMASSQGVGQTVAVATILAAAHTCD